MPDRTSTEQENNLAEQAAMTESKAKIAESELKLALAKKGIIEVTTPAKPPSAKEVAEANAAIAQADQKTGQSFKDSWKGPDIKALDGKITSDGTFIESRILAGKTMNAAFDNLIKAIKENARFINNSTFVICNAADFPAIQRYYSVTNQIEVLKNIFTTNISDLKTLLDQSKDGSLRGGSVAAIPLLAGYAAAGALRTVVDIVSLFRTNTNFVNSDLPVEEINMIASFTHAALKKDWKVYYPSMVPVGLVSDNKPGKFLTAWSELRVSNETLKDHIRKLDQEISICQASLLTVPPPDTLAQQKINDRINDLSVAKDKMQSLLSVYDQLEKLLITTDAASNISMQSAIINAERLIDTLSRDNSFIIKLAVVSRGSNKITENLFRSARITHSGGTAISCLVFDKEGTIVFAHSTHNYIDYQRGDKITKL